MKTRNEFENYLRNFVFGAEDSLVSTVGLISGVAIAGVARPTLILTGIIMVFVEAFSMGVGSLLSENSAAEYKSGKEVPLSRSMLDGLTMFLSYLGAGVIVLLPYLIFSRDAAFYISIIVSLVALFVVGIISARISKVNMVRRGFVMIIVGGGAILIGIAVGQVIELVR